MLKVNDAMGNLILAIKESPEYGEYLVQLDKVKQCPGLKEQIDEFRTRNYLLQMQTNEASAFEQLDQFEKEFEDFRENPLVSDFLAAELALCRMVQEINRQIAEALQFE